ncbi:MAG: SGNH/GDSL hydrolase family protein [Rubrivivax sp.]|nr:SGNH/GDSL hydrolase family protein [Rubrivivax sp.]
MSLTLKLALAPVWVAQALRTRQRMPRLPEASGPRQGQVGKGPPLRLLVAGDSSAAGVGVALQRQALAAPLAAYLAEAASARVHWRLVARSGVTTAQVLGLLQDEPHLHADIAVVVTGVNDVVDQVASHRAVAARDALANWLRNHAGVRHVVFAPLPPVHQFPGLPRPLRWVAGADARRHDRALATWAARRRDVSYVDIGLQLNPGVMAQDGFHPGAPIYRQCATMIARHIAEHLWPGVRP